MTASPRLAIRGIRKTFGANVALAGLDLTIEAGRTRALVGQNGSGKSTLVKILAGIYAPDRGEVSVDGVALPLPTRPSDLKRAGISFVHQSLGLVGTKSVTENIAVGDFVLSRVGTIDWRAERTRARTLLDRIGADIDPDLPLAALGPADQSKVAIARAIRSHVGGGGLLVLDEPSRALPPDALREFHATIGRLVGEGTAVLLISHNLEEVLEVADAVSVLRDGALVAQDVDPRTSSEQDLAKLLLGHELVATEESSVRAELADGDPVIVTEVEIDGRRMDPLTIRHGEIVGITGLAGDTWEALPYALAGARPARGSLALDGRVLPLATLTPKRAIDAGIALVPEQRMEHGLAATATIAENMALPWYRFGSSRRLVRWRRVTAEVSDLIRSLGVRPMRTDAVVGQLSGGNQQKVLLGKWLLRRPELFLLHEPTQAVDVGARDSILRAIRAAAAEGAAVLYASAQPTDLVEIADRILVCRRGRLFEIAEKSQSAILEAVYPVHIEPREESAAT